MPDTAKRTARVPILGEDGRISDDYIPAAIGEGVESAEAAAKRAETAATSAGGSATAAGQSATKAASSASAASTSAAKAQESATAAGGAATQAQSAKQAAEAAKTSAESARDSSKTAASQAQQSAEAAATSASSVADKFISSAQATTLEPGSQATASVENQVLTIGVPKGEKGDTPTVGIGTVETLPAGSPATATTTSTDTGVNVNLGIPKGDPGDVSAVQVTEGSDLSVSTGAGTVTIDDSALRARIAELENQAANVVTGTSTGLVAHGEDAYAQKPIETRIKGKTWVNRWPVLSGTNNGITVATDGTGLVTVTGTATADADVTADVSGWAAGKSYTTMISATPTGCSAYFEVQKPSGNTSIDATTAGATLNVASDATNCVAGVHVTGGTTVNASFRVMLVDGTEAPDCFTPCASITSVQAGNLVTSGKNLLDISAWTKVGRSGQLTVQPDGSWKCDGYGTAAVSGFISPILPPGSYRVDVSNFTDGAQVGLACSVAQSGFTWNRVWSEYGCEYIAFSVSRFTFASSVPFRIGIMINSAKYGEETQPTIYVYDPQLELGSTATAYEPPTVTTTPLPEVELRSLPNGTCDELVIAADGTCEVERKTGYIASYTDEEVTGEYVSTGDGLEAGASIVYELDESTTEPQTSVTLPALPAPTFNQYHDSPVPSDTSTQYVRDINIAFSELQAQVSATTVREATNG